MVRRYTNLILSDIDDGLLSSDILVKDLLGWLSEEEVEEFAKSELYTEEEEEEEEGEEEEEDSYDVWVGGCVLNESISLERARDIKQLYVLDGYDDVIVSRN